MQVKIIKAKYPEYWYADKIGEVFDVTVTGNTLTVTEDINKVEREREISFEDCELVEVSPSSKNEDSNPPIDEILSRKESATAKYILDFLAETKDFATPTFGFSNFFENSILKHNASVRKSEADRIANEKLTTKENDFFDIKEFIESCSDLIGHDQNTKLAMMLTYYWMKDKK